MQPKHPNEESLLDADPSGEERHGIEDFVPDGLEDASNIEDPAESEAAEAAAEKVENATQLG